MIPVLVFTESLGESFSLGIWAYLLCLFVCLFGTEYSTGMRRRRLSQKKKKEEKRWRRKKERKKRKKYSRFYYRTVAVRYCTGTAQGKRKKRKKERKRKEKKRSNCIIILCNGVGIGTVC